VKRFFNGIQGSLAVRTGTARIAPFCALFLQHSSSPSLWQDEFAMQTRPPYLSIPCRSAIRPEITPGSDALPPRAAKSKRACFHPPCFRLVSNQFSIRRSNASHSDFPVARRQAQREPLFRGNNERGGSSSPGCLCSLIHRSAMIVTLKPNRKTTPRHGPPTLHWSSFCLRSTVRVDPEAAIECSLAAPVLHHAPK